ncbi:MAG: IS256 family transposase [Burkholderiales bacterium]|nr:IS256 family transposase [Burkholderiales bacterium]
MDEITSNVVAFADLSVEKDPLNELIRQGARRLLSQAIEFELEERLAELRERRLADGRRSVVRNGYHPERQVQTGIGPVTVQIPKIRARDGKPVVFRSALVPPYVRKSRSLKAALPWLYLKGVSSGEMSAALGAPVGAEATGLSASTVSRLKKDWGQEYDQWCRRRLDKDQWVYIWADGIYSGLRATDNKLCVLVVIGVNERGEKHFLAIEDGIRESTQSWREVLLGLKSRGMNAPRLAVGDGAMGFWAALDEVYGQTPQQRCWVHKMVNVMNCMPKSMQPRVKSALHEIWQAPTKDEANKAFDLFEEMFEDKYPKAVNNLRQDREELMAFYDFPAQHWQSLRTTNPIESTFATIRHRTKRAKGCLTDKGMLHMMFKLAECAQKNWRRLRGFDFLAKVITGVRFVDGVEAIDKPQREAA